MKKVAKLLMIDPDDKYLLMYRSNHPVFGDDPDLPGGTIEDNETTLAAMLREVIEEAGVEINERDVREIYAGTDYSTHGTHYTLFMSKLSSRPKIVVSWEHSSYEWLDRDSFLKLSKDAKDTYMRMVHDSVQNDHAE